MPKAVFIDTNIPKAFRKSMFQDYDTERGDPEILNEIKQWDPSDSHPSLLLQGPSGSRQDNARMCCA